MAPEFFSCDNRAGHANPDTIFYKCVLKVLMLKL